MTTDIRTQSRILSLVFTDLVDSTNLKTQLGDLTVATLMKRHRDHVTQLSTDKNGRVIDWAGDGCFLTFESSSEAVLFCINLQKTHRDEDDLPEVRMGIHVGEITETINDADLALPVQVDGLAVDLAARVSSLAGPNQILLSESVFDTVRARLRQNDFDEIVEWRAHGDYELKGIENLVSIAEIGIAGCAPLQPPGDSEKAHRAVKPSDEETLGWRPAVGLVVPNRPNWTIVEKLGEGGFGEVWLAEHSRTHRRHVLKFCFESTRLRGLKREILLFRVLRETLGDRKDIARILDWQFDEPPYFIESEYTEGGSLKDWAEARGGLESVPLETRLEFVAQTATALSAAHSVGVLHKDIKPANLLVNDGAPDEKPQISLTDFGIGLLTDKELLAEKGITMADLTVTYAMEGDNVQTGGTHLYMAPELHEGSPPTVQSDIYSLGVMLFQMVVSDFSRSIAPGFERDVEDKLLLGDILACVDGQPEKRLKSAASLAERIHELPARREAEAEEERKRERRRTTKRRMQQFRFLAAASLLVLLFVGYLGYQQRERADFEANARVEKEEAYDLLDEEKKRSVEMLYYSQIATSAMSLADGQTSFARAALGEAPKEHRAWEWGHLLLEAYAGEIENRDAGEAQWDDLRTNAENWFNSTPVNSTTLPGHGTAVDSMEVVGENSLLSGGNDGKAIHWDLDSGAILHTFAEGGEVEWNARMTSDQKYVVTSRPWDRSMRVWDVASGDVLRVLAADLGELIEMVRISPDDARIYTSTGHGLGRIWGLESGEVLTVLEGHTASVTDIRNIGNAKLATASIDGSVRIWNERTGVLESSVVGPLTADITRVELSPTGRYAAALTSDGRTMVWNTADGKKVIEVADRSGTRNYGAFSPDETAIVLPSADKGANLWSLADGTMQLRIGEGEERVVSTFFNAKGDAIFTGSNTGSIKVWSPGIGSEPNVLRGHSDIIYHVGFDHSGTRIVTSGYDGKAVVWDAKSQQKLATLSIPGEEFNSTYFSPSDDILLTRTWKGVVAYWDGKTYERLETPYTPPPGSGRGLGGPRVELTLVMSGLGRTPITHDRKLLSGERGSFVIRDLDTGETVGTFKDQKGATGLTNFSHDGKRAVSGSINGVIWVWDIATGKAIAELKGHSGAISYASFSPDDSKIISSSMDHSARVWDAQTGDPIHVFKDHTSVVVKAEMNSTGELIATGAADNKIMLWDAASGERLHTLEGLPGSVNIVEFNPAGDRVFGMTVDGMAVWATNGKKLLELSAPEPLENDGVKPLFSYARWSPDGQSIVAAFRDGTVRVFPSVKWSELQKEGLAGTTVEELLKTRYRVPVDSPAVPVTESDD